MDERCAVCGVVELESKCAELASTSGQDSAALLDVSQKKREDGGSEAIAAKGRGRPNGGEERWSNGQGSNG